MPQGLKHKDIHPSAPRSLPPTDPPTPNNKQFLDQKKQKSSAAARLSAKITSKALAISKATMKTQGGNTAVGASKIAAKNASSAKKTSTAAAAGAGSGGAGAGAGVAGVKRARSSPHQSPAGSAATASSPGFTANRAGPSSPAGKGKGKGKERDGGPGGAHEAHAPTAADKKARYKARKTAQGLAAQAAYERAKLHNLPPGVAASKMAAVVAAEALAEAAAAEAEAAGRAFAFMHFGGGDASSKFLPPVPPPVFQDSKPAEVGGRKRGCARVGRCGVLRVGRGVIQR